MKTLIMDRVEPSKHFQIGSQSLSDLEYYKSNTYISLMEGIEKDHKGELFNKLDELGILEDIFPDINGLKTVGRCFYHDEDAFSHMKMVYTIFRQLLEEKIKIKGLDLEIFKLPLDHYINNFRNIDGSVHHCSMGVIANTTYSKETEHYMCGTFASLAAFTHDIGKYKSYRKQGEKVTFHGHDKNGGKIMTDFCNKNNFPTNASHMVIALVEGHMYPLSLFTSKLNDYTKSFNKFFERYNIYVPFILSISLCDMYAKKVNLNRANEKENYKTFIEKLFHAYNLYIQI